MLKRTGDYILIRRTGVMGRLKASWVSACQRWVNERGVLKVISGMLAFSAKNVKKLYFFRSPAAYIPILEPLFNRYVTLG
jgi:hypothetical protein